jgi:hypothetical protein
VDDQRWGRARFEADATSRGLWPDLVARTEAWARRFPGPFAVSLAAEPDAPGPPQGLFVTIRAVDGAGRYVSTRIGFSAASITADPGDRYEYALRAAMSALVDVIGSTEASGCPPATGP